MNDMGEKNQWWTEASFLFIFANTEEYYCSLNPKIVHIFDVLYNSVTFDTLWLFVTSTLMNMMLVDLHPPPCHS